MAQAAVKILDVQISKLSLTAPVAGTILSRAVEPGEFVSPGASLFVIADLNRLTITVYVPEDRYGQIKLEQKGECQRGFIPGPNIRRRSDSHRQPRRVHAAQRANGGGTQDDGVRYQTLD